MLWTPIPKFLEMTTSDQLTAREARGVFLSHLRSLMDFYFLYSHRSPVSQIKFIMPSAIGFILIICPAGFSLPFLQLRSAIGWFLIFDQG